jgi:hypothetical protein
MWQECKDISDIPGFLSLLVFRQQSLPGFLWFFLVNGVAEA